jgi:hypothetical protein
LVGSLGCHAGARDFYPALAALVSPVQNIFFLAAHFFTLCVSIAQQSGQAVVLGRLSLSMCLCVEITKIQEIKNLTPECMAFIRGGFYKFGPRKPDHVLSTVCAVNQIPDQNYNQDTDSKAMVMQINIMGFFFTKKHLSSLKSPFVVLCRSAGSKPVLQWSIQKGFLIGCRSKSPHQGQIIANVRET